MIYFYLSNGLVTLFVIYFRQAKVHMNPGVWWSCRDDLKTHTFATRCDVGKNGGRVWRTFQYHATHPLPDKQFYEAIKICLLSRNWITYFVTRATSAETIQHSRTAAMQQDTV
eukprot:GHVU01067434.1.p3 GENE.GHVU01067434.1~~GHVU01067434.1.p3  ORF type:complete len:113 (-),score=7.85 GHVU01067434.1:1328-1666(-)